MSARGNCYDNAAMESWNHSLERRGAFNPGNATGAWLGGMAIGAGMPLTQLPWVGVAMALGALALTLWSASLERRPFAGPSTLA
ncbi:MAG: hypothetical protein GAK41_01166 [Burkholderia gladioli]|nr:MAG: hypothetical protein GAK41_01166 [Burkholderia gladioli]